MRGQVTISVHNGNDVSIGHNLRLPEIVEHEPHIDPHGRHETWLHTDLREFYNDTFGAAQRAYDNKARACRRIGDYLDKLIHDADAAKAENKEIVKRNKLHMAAGEKLEKLKVAKKPVYEMIVGIYAQGDLNLPERECHDALRLWLFGDGTPEHESWEERNPGLKLVGAYYHADEPDAKPHLHLDYVPVAECSKGMSVQNSLEGALNASGIESGKVVCADGVERLKTAQEQFTDAERDGLQAICEGMDLEVLHPQRGKRSKHKATDELKRETRAKELEEQVEQLTNDRNLLARSNAALRADRDRLQAECAQAKNVNDELQKANDALKKENENLDLALKLATTKAYEDGRKRFEQSSTAKVFEQVSREEAEKKAGDDILEWIGFRSFGLGK